VEYFGVFKGLFGYCVLISFRSYGGILTLEILLIWRSTTMPEESDREEALERFQQVLADVLDWKSARYDDGQILLHT
jgi:hypothetical protein